MATGSIVSGSDDRAEELLREVGTGTGTETGDGELGVAMLTWDDDDAEVKPGREVLTAAGSGAALLQFLILFFIFFIKQNGLKGKTERPARAVNRLGRLPTTL
ncbi:unnamed protein product [Linum trigynum]|uniref:Uncharacterized protein n=1 Tax=Linum trigynum TaxID=586398 RepID=A0AAV2G391_9ROSI